ncbi:hypothetical protein [Pantoea rwandensis]|uniref:Uncharacterized protein n=1 Tax=Pantoea rwandensis TaxID=1076550 RepID=A0A1X1D339_9GAMM|nr:hypothetical protein [Pantoea rwandensis]ORM71085.1 hypothetical protein HA51_04135 [Pantoea rwandensis]
MKKVVVGALLLLATSSASAGLKIYQAPQDWLRSTGSAEEVRSYISDVDAGKFSSDSAYSPEVLKGINTYINALKTKIAPTFSAQDYKAFDNTLCKVSITTANTSPDDKSPPSVLSLNDFPENSRTGCIELTKNIEKLVGSSAELGFPASVKDNGLLSIDLIVSFTK